jgi:geranylgeranyl reductase family protein
MTDVAVIGAGPAGALAAYELARLGARVRFFDHSHPREKPCGGGVTGRALALVAGAIDIAALPARTIRAARFYDDRGRSATVPLNVTGDPLHPGLVVADRVAFDGRLAAAAAAAGADWIRDRVIDVAVDGAGAVVRTRTATYRAAWVIGADGANSLVRRRLDAQLRREELSVAAGYYVDGASSDEIVLEFVADPPGYLWSFPRPSHLAIGICAQAPGTLAAALRSEAARWIRDRDLAGGSPLRPYAWPIPSLSAAGLMRTPLAGRRWLLVGDAAGLVDPITREGIFFALRSAQLAAAALTAATDPAARYRASAHDEIVLELVRAARLKDGFFRPRFTRLLLDALSASSAVRGVMADLVAGQQSYATLKWRLAGTLEFGLAWRCLRGLPQAIGARAIRAT